MPICWYIPGTLSTEIFRASDQGGKIWVHAPSLVLGQFGCLRLAADGHSPGAPDGLLCSFGGSLADYNGSALAALAEGLRPHDYRVVDFGWDWRFHLVYAGSMLAAAIRASVTADDPCTLVGHSAGGLVARWAWSSLVDSGQTNLVRRVITLGTPHQGTYYPVTVWCGGAADVFQLVDLSSYVGGLIFSSSGGHLGRLWNGPTVAQLTATWPLLYDLLPVLGSVDSADDTYRGRLFEQDQWGGFVVPSALHLEYAREIIRPFLLGSNSLPPPHVLTTVAGTGYVTPFQLSDPDKLGRENCWLSTGAGDGVVTEVSATIAQSATYSAQWAHRDMPALAAASGWLVPAVLEVRLPPAPPPVARKITQPDSLNIYGPPLPISLDAGPGTERCGRRHCFC